MTLRINSIARTTPDSYGNIFGSMLPPTGIRPSTDLLAKTKKNLLDLNAAGQSAAGGDPATTLAAAQTAINALQPIKTDPPKLDAVDFGAGAMQGFKAVDAAKDLTVNDKPLSGGAQAGIGLVTAGANVGGQALINNKHEIAGTALKWGSAAVKPALSMAGATGGLSLLAIPLAAGAGAIKGSFDKKNRLKEETAATAYNTKLDYLKKSLNTQSADYTRLQNILSTAKSSNAPTVRFKLGGLLPTYVETSTANLEALLTPKKQAGGTVENTEDKEKQLLELLVKMYDSGIIDPEEAFQKINFDATGQQVNNIPKELIFKVYTKLQKDKKTTPMFKRGGKTKLLCTTCKTKTPLFKRGGKIDLTKENVIVDGPSHDEHNNTGIAGDKGLPVVSNGKKIAEIESLELSLNKKAVDKIESLRTAIKKGDEKAKVILGKVIFDELKNNTYDYTKNI